MTSVPVAAAQLLSPLKLNLWGNSGGCSSGLGIVTQHPPVQAAPLAGVTSPCATRATAQLLAVLLELAIGQLSRASAHTTPRL